MNFDINKQLDVKRVGNEYVVEFLTTAFNPQIADVIIDVLSARGYTVEYVTNASTGADEGFRLHTNLEGRNLQGVISEVQQTLSEQEDQTKQVTLNRVKTVPAKSSGTNIADKEQTIAAPVSTPPLGNVRVGFLNIVKNIPVLKGVSFTIVFDEIFKRISSSGTLLNDIMSAGIDDTELLTVLREIGFTNINDPLLTPEERFQAAREFFSAVESAKSLPGAIGNQEKLDLLNLMKRQVEAYFLDKEIMPKLVADLKTRHTPFSPKYLKQEDIEKIFSDLGLSIETDRTYLADITRQTLLDYPTTTLDQDTRNTLRVLSLPIPNSPLERGKTPTAELLEVIPNLVTDPNIADKIADILNIDKTSPEFARIHSALRIMSVFNPNSNDIVIAIFNDNDFKIRDLLTLQDGLKDFLERMGKEILRKNKNNQRDALLYGDAVPFLRFIGDPAKKDLFEEFLLLLNNQTIVGSSSMSGELILLEIVQMINQEPPRLSHFDATTKTAYNKFKIDELYTLLTSTRTTLATPTNLGTLAGQSLSTAIPSDNKYAPNSKVNFDITGNNANLPELANYYLRNNPGFVRNFVGLNQALSGFISQIKDAGAFQIIVNLLNTTADLTTIEAEIKNILISSKPPAEIFLKLIIAFFDEQLPAGIANKNDIAKNIATNFIYTILVLRTRQEDLIGRMANPTLAFGTHGVLKLPTTVLDIINKHIDGNRLNKAELVEDSEDFKTISIEAFKLEIRLEVLNKIKGNRTIAAAEIAKILELMRDKTKKVKMDGDVLLSSIFDVWVEGFNSDREAFIKDLETEINTITANPLTFDSEWKEAKDEADKMYGQIYIIVGKRMRLGKGKTEEENTRKSSYESLNDVAKNLEEFKTLYRNRILTQQIEITDAEAEVSMLEYVKLLLDILNHAPPINGPELKDILDKRAIQPLAPNEASLLLVLINLKPPIPVPVDMKKLMKRKVLAGFTIDNLRDLSKNLMKQELMLSLMKYEQYVQNKGEAARLQAKLPAPGTVPPTPVVTPPVNVNLGGQNIALGKKSWQERLVERMGGRKGAMSAGTGVAIGATAVGMGAVVPGLVLGGGVALVGLAQTSIEAGYNALKKNRISKIETTRDAIEAQKKALGEDLQALPSVIKTHTTNYVQVENATEGVKVKEEQLSKVNEVYNNVRGKIKDRIQGGKLVNNFSMAQYELADRQLNSVMQELDDLINQPVGTQIDPKVIANKLADMKVKLQATMLRMINEMESALVATGVRLSKSDRATVDQVRNAA